MVDIIRKNIPDLHFQKYLTIASTSVIVAFTYFIGVGIALITRQIRFDDYIILTVLFTISSGILGVCAILFFNAVFHLKNIPKTIKDV